MNIVKVKIYEYDEDAKSLIVGFASDRTEFQDPDSYPKLSYDLSFFSENDTIDDIKIKLAKAGAEVLRQQVLKESIGNNSILEQLKSMSGVTFDLPVSLINQTEYFKNEIEL
jgi:hypothetical protein